MVWGARNKQGTSGAPPKHTLLQPALIATASLVLGSMLQCKAALAGADCSSAPALESTAGNAVGSRASSLHSVSLRSALRGANRPTDAAASQASCHRGDGAGGALVSIASALLPRSYAARPLIDGYSVSAANGTVAREMRMEMNPSIANSSRPESGAPGAALESESGLEARFGVRWQTTLGPAWVQRVPSWLIQDAKTYHRRGLPVLHLWESTNYLLALGLSNHGVPGVYFSQKLP
jgi:hypothetical protein